VPWRTANSAGHLPGINHTGPPSAPGAAARRKIFLRHFRDLIPQHGGTAFAWCLAVRIHGGVM
jgi:hypothetical protein